MKVSLPALLLACALPPAAALLAALRAAPAAPATPSAAASGPALAGTDAARAYPNHLLVVSASAGLRLSRDVGAHWAAPRGAARRGGSIYAVAADPAHPGVAYATNGDIYRTTDGGQDWILLPDPGNSFGQAGATALACGPDGTLYAAGAAVLAYRRGQGWTRWGRGWPSDASDGHPPILLATSARGLYAAAGGHLYNLAGGGARWTPVHDWPGRITALALGPDRATPYVAMQGRGVWRLGPGAPRLLDEDGPPDGATISALAADPAGDDLYAATGDGLLRHHRPDDPIPRPWQRALSTPGDPIVALQPWRGGAGMLALSSVRGRLYFGVRAGGETLTWGGARARALGVATPLVAALSGAEWQRVGALPGLRLPREFSHNSACAFLGLTVSRSYDVCGPFRQFYFTYAGSAQFGNPLGLARARPDGTVVQDFEKARFAWRRGGGTHLAPLGDRIPSLGGRRFGQPTLAEAKHINTSGGLCPGKYCIDPRFYQFWRSYLDASGLSIFDYPISKALPERRNDGIGRLVWVQYFKNARLEVEPGGQVAVSYVQDIPGAPRAG